MRGPHRKQTRKCELAQMRKTRYKTIVYIVKNISRRRYDIITQNNLLLLTFYLNLHELISFSISLVDKNCVVKMSAPVNWALLNDSPPPFFSHLAQAQLPTKFYAA